MVTVLGINAFHADASAALIEDGKIICAAEEERFIRIKHAAGFPTSAIKWCLEYSSKSINNIDHIAINSSSKSNFYKKITFTILNRPNPFFVLDKILTKRKKSNLEFYFNEYFNDYNLNSKFHYLDHHLCHLASAYYCSPFKNSSLLSVDGFGDFASTSWGTGNNNFITKKGQVVFPHSLGIFYTAITQYLGFPNYGDEYKLMGLSPYGRPKYLHLMRKILKIENNGQFKLNLDFFRHVKERLPYRWEKGEPILSNHFSNKFNELFGPPRKKGEDLNQYHKDLASSAQCAYEEAFFNILNNIYEQDKLKAISIAGGCGANSVANGKITSNTPFEKVYIHPAPGDAGGAVGAALLVSNSLCLRKKNYNFTPYLGDKYTNGNILNVIESKSYREKLINKNILISRIGDPNLSSESDLLEKVCYEISNGKVIGWFYGQMEWGPRALGHRSILGDPRRSDMKDILNIKIKRRESFRPFAPSILEECVGDWFEITSDFDKSVPYMMKVYKFKSDKQRLVPAVCHVDGSGRLQSVNEKRNGRYYRLIKKFYELNKIPMLLNTSFNENEPIVRTVQECLDCFIRTKMDILVIQDFIIERK